MSLQRLRPLALVVVVVALAAPAAASGDDGQEVRRSGTCTASSEVTLRLRADDGRIRVELELDEVRRRSRWAIILLHERRIAFRGTLRASGDSLELRRSLPDWFGSDTVTARATGPQREACRVSARL